jgi:FkbM family methyltransferase
MIDHAVTLHETATGRWWLPERPGDAIVASMRTGQVADPNVVEECLQCVRPGTDVLDLGSNFGQMAVLFSRAIGDGVVHAFEAEPFVAAVLLRNASENATNVCVRQRAVWHTSGVELVFPEPDFVELEAWGSYGVDPTSVEGRKVLSLAVDDVMLPRSVSLIKVDVQGADLFAMRGARASIERHRPPIIFEFEPLFQSKFGTDWNDYERFVDEIDYRIAKIINGYNYLIVPR